MALKGSISKEIITNKILETFNGSFQYDKEIRIPIEENGELVQIKCVLTCAKTNVKQNDDVAIPGEQCVPSAIDTVSSDEHMEMSTEEKKNISRLAEMLDL